MSEQIIILGAGESGVGAALLAKSKGFDVFVSDSGEIKDNFRKKLANHAIPFEEKGHSELLLRAADLVIKSPGISPKTIVLKEAFRKNIEIIDELEFAFRYTSKPIIAVTGTNGKTTTTLLIHHLLVASGIMVGLAGNVGHSLAQQVIEDKPEVYVVEMSSFQLDGIKSFRPDIAVILNITPDHLDRYNFDFAQYVDSKMQIARSMQPKDCLIYFDEDEILHQKVHELNQSILLAPFGFKQSHTSVGFKSKNGLTILRDRKSFEVGASLFPLKGDHNILNMLAAISAVLQYGLSEKLILQHLHTFKNAPNRMEYVATINGVEFVNDTKATNVEAVYFALGSYSNDIIWIAGGKDKGNNYGKIKELVKKKVKAMICLGVDNAKLMGTFDSLVPNVFQTQDVKMAVRIALANSTKNDVVLLSPACASFDLFKNYEQRGKLFKKAVLELKLETDG